MLCNGIDYSNCIEHVNNVFNWHFHTVHSLRRIEVTFPPPSQQHGMENVTPPCVCASFISDNAISMDWWNRWTIDIIFCYFVDKLNIKCVDNRRRSAIIFRWDQLSALETFIKCIIRMGLFLFGIYFNIKVGDATAIVSVCVC